MSFKIIFAITSKVTKVTLKLNLPVISRDELTFLADDGACDFYVRPTLFNAGAFLFCFAFYVDRTEHFTTGEVLIIGK